MPLILDHQLRERVTHDTAAFPISFFENEYAALPSRTIPPHWHPEFECVTAVRQPVETQVGQARFSLLPGESVFINGNVLHGFRQALEPEPDPLPNIVFSGAVVASESGAIHEKYVRPILECDALPYVLVRGESGWPGEVNRLLGQVYDRLRARDACYELAVQRALNALFECLYRHLDELPRLSASRTRVSEQVRMQQMLAFIRDRYAEDIGLTDIAAAASVSRSEANRCFNACMGCTPVDALIQYRLETARRLLGDTGLTLREVAEACGFNSESYFCRRFRRAYGCAPGHNRVKPRSI